MTRYTDTIERAGHELRVSYSASPGDPGRTSGPPERCYPPEPPEFEIEKIELQWSIPDDLGPDARAQRPIWLDVTDLLLEIGGDDFVGAVEDELLDRLADDDGPPDWAEPDYDYPEDEPRNRNLGDDE
ncbi:MAG TPA: hypothetical protein PKV98_07835 [Burkholderiaceae bacterium]|nr:hypothetical protein [Burkholderiaceae bacterium]